MFRTRYGNVREGNPAWNKISAQSSELYPWDDDSTYIHEPPYFADFELEPGTVSDIKGMRLLALLGDSVTTDHISPAGAIQADSPAGSYLLGRDVSQNQFNTFGARRGDDRVMSRGTFGNIRIKNQLVEGVEGAWTRHMPSGEKMTIYDAAMRYKAEGVPLLVIGGKEYGTGSSRDWAAKGTMLLGVRAVIAERFSFSVSKGISCVSLVVRWSLPDTAVRMRGEPADHALQLPGCPEFQRPFAGAPRAAR